MASQPSRPPVFHDLFEAQARARPEAPAIESERGVLSYGQVNGAALQSCGVF